MRDPDHRGRRAPPPTADVQDNGVGSDTAEYVRFVGLVSRGWNIGFGNGWAGGVDSTEVSNGHWEIEACISYSNGRTGFTFFSANGFHLKNSISAHNGSSSAHSWSSGVTLFEATGTNLIENTISFENTDAERRTDGSGFIVDESSSNATFVNNLAFGNSGSCLRLTKSSGTRFINNTCYRNSQFGSQATGPSNPGELYFTNSGVTVQGVTFTNNVIVGTGTAPNTQPVVNMPTSGWTNNVVTTGTPTYFTAPTGTNPSFVPASGATQLIGKGATGNGVPTTDIGFDPKCLVKRTPVMVGQVARVSTWQFDVDIDYIKSIGGVAKCFNPGTRSGTPDIGAYRAGTVTAVMPGSCVAAANHRRGRRGGGRRGRRGRLGRRGGLRRPGRSGRQWRRKRRRTGRRGGHCRQRNGWHDEHGRGGHRRKRRRRGRRLGWRRGQRTDRRWRRHRGYRRRRGHGQRRCGRFDRRHRRARRNHGRRRNGDRRQLARRQRRRPRNRRERRLDRSRRHGPGRCQRLGRLRLRRRARHRTIVRRRANARGARSAGAQRGGRSTPAPRATEVLTPQG